MRVRTMNGSAPDRLRKSGARILLVAAVVGLAVAIFNYLWQGNGIHGSAGALLVVISSALMVAAAAVLLFGDGIGRGLVGTLVVLIALDILGTGFAAYMLEADWLVVAMALALIGWIVRLVSPRASPGSDRLARGGAR
jgi:quinoprotein glucose dehydrogenase